MLQKFQSAGTSLVAVQPIVERLEADAEDVGGAHLATVGEIHGLAAIPLHAEFDQEDSRFESLGYLERLLSIGRLRLRSPMSLYAVPQFHVQGTPEFRRYAATQ